MSLELFYLYYFDFIKIKIYWIKSLIQNDLTLHNSRQIIFQTKKQDKKTDKFYFYLKNNDEKSQKHKI